MVLLKGRPYADRRQAARQLPEQMIGDFVNFWGDTRYCRERDYGNTLLGNGPIGLAANAAIAGLLLKDKQLLRLSARFALALAMCGRWDDGMICYFPGSTFEHRCFVQSLCVQEIALALDLAGECDHSRVCGNIDGLVFKRRSVGQLGSHVVGDLRIGSRRAIDHRFRFRGFSIFVLRPNVTARKGQG